MGGGWLGTLDLDKAFCTYSLITTARTVDVWGVVLRRGGFVRGGRRGDEKTYEKTYRALDGASVHGSLCRPKGFFAGLVGVLVGVKFGGGG